MEKEDEYNLRVKLWFTNKHRKVVLDSKNVSIFTCMLSDVSVHIQCVK